MLLISEKSRYHCPFGSHSKTQEINLDIILTFHVELLTKSCVFYLVSFKSTQYSLSLLWLFQQSFSLNTDDCKGLLMGLQTSGVHLQFTEYLPARELSKMHMCVYFSRLRTAQCLPSSLRKMVQRSFVICPYLLLQLHFLLCPQLCTLCSSHAEILLVHQVSHAVSFSPGSSSAQSFLCGQNVFHIPLPPQLPVFPSLISAQITFLWAAFPAPPGSFQMIAYSLL